MKAILMLEDGKVFAGLAAAGQRESIGELILNTAVVGYQEMLTDPANAGKILVLTYPLIGNYGIAPKFNESKKAWLAGLVIKEKTRIFSNWQAKSSFDEFIREQNLPVISGVDTRALAVHLRQKGQMLGIISTQDLGRKELLLKIEASKKKPAKSLLPEISLKKPAHLSPAKPRKKKIVILDLGITNSTIRQLQSLGLGITLLPYNTSTHEILRAKPAGLIISNGPEQDPALEEVIVNIKPLVGRLPMLGISTGHQVLASALGAKITKLKLGHHGVNYPIHTPTSYKGEITVQNHSWVVDAGSLSRIKGVKITGHNLNDNSVEEIESRRLKFIGIQYYPASPGFEQVNGIFNKFIKMLTKE